MSVLKALATIFFIEQLRWLLLNYVLVSERIFKKVSGEIAFDLITLYHVQIQEPTKRSTTTRAFVSLAKFAEFIITIYLKQEVDDDLSIYMDEHSPCGLSMIGDIKIYQCLPYQFLSQSCFYCPNLITLAPL